MRHLVIAVAILCATSTSAFGQSQAPSHWGVVVGFVPTWEPMKSVEPLTTLIFDEDNIDLLRGSEFRVGIARGRRDSGDWGVSFIRKRLDDSEPVTIQEGLGCQGSSNSPNEPLVMACESSIAVRTPDALQISGLEVHKHFSFVTIKQRVQIGLNIAGGFGFGQGGFSSELFDAAFTCTFPPGEFPQFGESDEPCGEGVQGPVTMTPTGTSVEPFAVIQAYDGKYLPLGKIEIAGTVILTPQVKVRIGGGFNFPGKANFGITGIYFFGRE